MNLYEGRNYTTPNGKTVLLKRIVNSGQEYRKLCSRYGNRKRFLYFISPKSTIGRGLWDDTIYVNTLQEQQKITYEIF